MATGVRHERPALSPRASTLRAWVELGRVSNLPTVVSNLLVGWSLGAAGGALDPAALGRLLAGVGAFYLAGMFLNDAVDLPRDRVARPERPIPSGRIGRATAVWVSVAALGVGLVVLLPLGAPVLGFAAALVACIVLYDLLHHRMPASILLMGACRGLLYPLAAAAAAWPLAPGRIVPMAAILAGYTVAFTAIARSEAGSTLDARRWLAPALPVGILAAAAFHPPADPIGAAVAGAAVLLWLGIAAVRVLGRPPRTLPAVLQWLSGFCLIDAFFLTLLDRGGLALVAAGCFAVTVWAHRRVLGT